MARSHYRGLCGGDDGSFRHQRTQAADRRQPHARRSHFLAALAALLLAAPASASAPVADNRTLALAAGWKASFLCSGLFVAGLPEKTIAQSELVGAYPQFAPHIAELPVRIIPAEKRVEVSFDAAMPPRIARFVRGAGCMQLPIGAKNDAVIGPVELIGGPDARAQDARNWPLGDAQATASLPVGQRRRLDAVLAEAMGGSRFASGAHSVAVLVIHKGKIIGEEYRAGYGRHTPLRTWSVAKSLASALVGRAAELGVIDPEKPAHVPEWEIAGDPRAEITVDQLLRMQSGLFTNGPGNRTDAVYFGGSTVAETAAAAPLEAMPGTRFQYANNDTLLAARALMTDLGEAAPTFAYTHLLWPLGMTRTTIEGDWQGNPILSSQVWMTARDLGRLALLHLNDGMWAGERLLSEGWVKDAITPVGPQPPHGARYGRGIWLPGAEQGLPNGSYAFLGNRGQVAVIVPSEDLIVIRRGVDAAGVSFDGYALTREVIAALKP